jgi:hypothetical protein
MSDYTLRFWDFHSVSFVSVGPIAIFIVRQTARHSHYVNKAIQYKSDFNLT